MILLLLAALQQVPAIEEKTSVEIPAGKCLALKVSRAGKYLIRGEPGKLNVHDAKTLERVKTLEVPWTAFAFDGKDETFGVVGDGLVRFRAGEWTEIAKEPLKDAGFRQSGPGGRRGIVVDLAEEKPHLLPGQAWITADGEIYYRSKDGGIVRAFMRDGQRAFDPVETPMIDGPADVEAILGVVDQFILLSLRGGRGAVQFRARQKVFSLAACHSPLVAGELAAGLVFVGKQGEGMYHTGTLKAMTHQEDLPVTAAALDLAKGWVFIADEKGLRAWTPRIFYAPVRYEGFPKGVTALEIDGGARMMYVLEEKRLSRWQLKD